MTWIMLWLALFMAFPLAAVQLAPTWELKQRSQRSEVSAEHQPGYGHLPPQYWSQVIVPWRWYPNDVDALLSKLPSYAGGAGTNKVEAHLYFGIIPLLLALGGLLCSWRDRADSARLVRWWLLIGLIFLLYTPGWFLPVTQHLPGFNFFRGPGRYGIVTALAVALAAGLTFSRMKLTGLTRFIITLLILAITTYDLHWVAHQRWYSVILDHPVVERRSESPVRQLLARETQPPRLFAPMANVANLLNVSSTPVYLGIGPAEYFDPQFIMPTGPQGGLDLTGQNVEQIRWLQQAGVTHIYALDRLNTQHWPVELAWTGIDPFLHSAFGRGAEPTFLYRLKNSRGRISWLNQTDLAATVEITENSAHRITARCQSTKGGRIVLTELHYPGWQLQIDGKLAPMEREGMFRAATVGPGSHELIWTYRPASVYWGRIISAVTFLSLLIASILFRRSLISNP